MISLIQFRGADGNRGVAAIRDGRAAATVPGVSSTLDLARRALAEGTTLDALIRALGDGPPVDLATVELLAPIDHEDPAHLLLRGPGLTHLGSAVGRDKIHRAVDGWAHPPALVELPLQGGEGGQ